MVDYQPARAQENSGNGTTLLEIRGREGEVPHPFPVIVQNLSAGVVTLEVGQPLKGVDWDNLTGRLSTLRLPAVGRAPQAKMEGTVSWVRHVEDGESRLVLGLELADSQKNSAATLRAPRDLKVFWDRWDKIQVKPRILTEHRIYIIGLLLMLAGMFLLFPDIQPLKLTGFFLGLSGCLVISARILWSIFGPGLKSSGQEST